MFQKSTNANDATGPGQTVDLATAKLIDLYGTGGSVPRLNRSEPSKGHVRNGTSSPTASNNGIPDNGVYGDDRDLISGSGSACAWPHQLGPNAKPAQWRYLVWCIEPDAFGYTGSFRRER